MFFLCGIPFRIFYMLFLFVGLHFLAPSLRPIDCLAGESVWEDPSEPAPLQKANCQGAESRSSKSGQRFVGSLIGFYKKYIGPVDGSNCPSYPTCSQYSLNAIRKHGVLIGLIMTADRLMHEYDEIRIAPLVKVNDSRQAYDPVENNDFWWYNEKKGNGRQ